MIQPDELSAVIAEAGPLDESIVVVARLSDERWTLQFDGVDVQIEYDPQTGRVMFTTVIGPPPPLRAAAVHEILLAYSSLWRQTGGVRMALAAPGGDVLQMTDLPAAELRPDLVATVAVNLARRTLEWRGFFESDEAAEPPTASLDYQSSSDFVIRA